MPLYAREGKARWIVRLGWAAVAAQIACVALARFVGGTEIPLLPLGAVIAVAALANVATAWLARRGSRAISPEQLVGVALGVDTLLLTAMLWLAGGASNPFSVLYLVHVTLAAVLTTTAWTWVIVAASVAGYGLLFTAPERSGALVHHAMHGHAMHGHAMHPQGTSVAMHLYGMFVAFTLTACVIAWFVGRVTRALGEEREKSARAARLLGLTTLAAGAAHELATPLATIKVAAAELERALASHAGPLEAMEDLRLIRAEVERSRDVLDRLAASSGESAGEPVTHVSVDAFCAEVLRELGANAARVDVRRSGETLRVPRRALARAVANLLDNAFDASPSDARVELVVDARTHAQARIEVNDRGSGLSEAVRTRIGEPFFTTKAPGRGMGLGVFLVRTLVEHLGGSLEHHARREGGTSAVIALYGAAA